MNFSNPFYLIQLKTIYSGKFVPNKSCSEKKLHILGFVGVNIYILTIKN